MMQLCSAGSLARLLVGVALPLVASFAAAEPQVTTNYDHRFDFGKVRNIVIEPFSRTDPATITVTDSQIAGITAALAEVLQAGGFVMVTDNREADLFLSWLLVTEGRIDPAAVEGPRYYAAAPPAGKHVEGTLVVEMTDPLRMQPVWRTSIQSRLKSRPDAKQARATQQAAARAVLADFPPH